MLTVKDVFEKTREAALAATDEDEKPLQVDYSALEGKMERALSGRTIELIHINKFHSLFHQFQKGDSIKFLFTTMFPDLI